MPWAAPIFRPRSAFRGTVRPPDPRPSAAARGYGSAAWERVRLAVIARDGGVCQIPGCGRVCSAPGEAHVDHVEPKPPGEPAEATPLEGLRLLCRRCHSIHGRKWQSLESGQHGVDEAPQGLGDGPAVAD